MSLLTAVRSRGTCGRRSGRRMISCAWIDADRCSCPVQNWGSGRNRPIKGHPDRLLLRRLGGEAAGGSRDRFVSALCRPNRGRSSLESSKHASNPGNVAIVAALHRRPLGAGETGARGASRGAAPPVDAPASLPPTSAVAPCPSYRQFVQKALVGIMRVCEGAEWVVASGSGGPPLRTICSTGLGPGGQKTPGFPGEEQPARARC
jgi:hypothetical protein